jgi:hypothetical protein
MSLLDTASLVVTPNGTKASKLYSVVPSDGSGDLSVTRATTATRVNSSGLIESVASNVPRLDYTNGSCPSILVEPQRTNLFTYSQDFSNSAWTKVDIQTETTGITDPANGTTGVRLIPFVGFNSNVSTTISTIIGTAYTVTVWIKGTANGTINFNHGGISLAPQNNISYTTQWQKFQYNFTADSVTTLILFGGFFSWSAGQNVDFTFAQIEAGSYATSYIPTTSASVTRNADVISKTGISSLIGQTEGTMFLDVKAQLNNADEQDFSISDGTTNNRAFIRLASTGVIRAIGVFAGSTEFNIGSTPYTTGTRYKIALSYKNNDVVLYINGTNVASTNTTTISGTLSRLGFDVFTNGAQTIVSPINSASIWKTRLTNTQLAQLTTI